MQSSHDVTVEVGGIAVALRTSNQSLVRLLEQRFRRFLNPAAEPAFQFDITVIPQREYDEDADLTVEARDGTWVMRRGDFQARWNLADRNGHIRQTLNAYAIDSILRIVHTLVLSMEGGFLLHASSAIRDGRAYVFTGPSGAGKSTIVGLAPPGVTVLTDEISYVELSDAGEPASAPVAALFRLGRGADNHHAPLDSAQTVKTLMRNILFFADDRRLVGHVLDAACDFASRVPAYTLQFAPDERVWRTLG